MRRGEVWWVDFPPPTGHRPAVLVSRPHAYQVRSAVTVVPLTRTARPIRSQVALSPEDGVPKRSVANADDITTIAKERVREHITTLSQEKVSALDAAIKFALDLP